MVVEEVAAAFENDKLRFGGGRNAFYKVPDIFDRPKFVMVALDKKYRFREAYKEREVAVLIDRCADAYQPRYACVARPDFHSRP